MLYYSFCRNNRSERPGTCATWKSARYFLYHGARALRGVRGTGGIGSHRPPAAAPPVQRHAGRTGFLHRRSNRRLRGPAVQPPTSTAGLPRVLLPRYRRLERRGMGVCCTAHTPHPTNTAVEHRIQQPAQKCDCFLEFFLYFFFLSLYLRSSGFLVY